MGCTNSVEKKPKHPAHGVPANEPEGGYYKAGGRNNNRNEHNNNQVAEKSSDDNGNNANNNFRPTESVDRNDDSSRAAVTPAPVVVPAAAERDLEYEAALENLDKRKYKMKGPRGIDARHEAIPCFKTGLLYRCVAGNEWAFYNDTQEYEMYVTVVCGAESHVNALGKTKVAANSDGTQTFTAVIYPGDTEPFWEGKFDGFKCSLSAKPLSAEYRNKMIQKADEAIKKEALAVRSVSQSADPELVLRACVKSNTPFVDPSFPPNASSLFRDGTDTRRVAGASWMRPKQYLDDTLHSHIIKFRKVEANDIDQGQLGDCWLLSAIAAIAEYPVRIERMFNHPELNPKRAEEEERVGGYRITLNVNGWWTNVIIDDYLPCIGGKPCFAKNVEDPAELWAALMEKAFAKVFGSYSAITGGDALVALQDMTGYPISRFDSDWKVCQSDKDKSDAFFEKLVGFDNAHFLTIVNTPGFDTACYAGGKNDAAMEEKYKKAGLALGHAYTLIDVAHFPHHDNLQLCKIRNPWGNGTEWTGEWSDESPLWTMPQYKDVRSKCNYTGAAADGAFWMPFSEVKKYFDGGGVCFSREKWFDYRVRGAFTDATPTVCLEITVTKPVQAYITMSQKDKRAMLAENKAYKYGAIMISVCKRAEGPNSVGKYAVHLNSNTDPENPTDKYTFNFSRDHAMKYTFTPSAEPYLIVPRIHGNTGVCNFVLGFITDSKVGSDLTIRFRQLDKENKVFANYPKFSYDANTTPLVETQYQFVDPANFKAPQKKVGPIIA